MRTWLWCRCRACGWTYRYYMRAEDRPVGSPEADAHGHCPMCGDDRGTILEPIPEDPYTDAQLGLSDDYGTCEECGGDGCESCRCERCLQSLEGGECPACGDVDE